MAEQFTVVEPEVVPGRYSPVSRTMPRKLRLDEHMRSAWIDAERIIAFKGVNFQIMHMHMFTGRDRFRRETDDLIIAPHRFAGSNVSHGDLVPGWNRIPDR